MTGEPALTMLMPASVAVSWAALLADGLRPRGALVAAIFYWGWALKNWVAGPLRGDAGLFTFAAYAYARHAAWSAGSLTVCAAIVAANYGAPALLFAPVPTAKLARKLKKSEAWVRVFRAYCVAAAAYWAAVALGHHRESH